MRKFIPFRPEASREPLDVTQPPPLPAVEVHEADKKIDLSYSFDGFFRFDRSYDIAGQKLTFEAIDMAGVGHLTEAGKPLLPSFGRYVQIPPNCDWKINVTTPDRPIQFDNINVAPAQPQLMDADAGKIEYDKTFYGRDELYPKELAEVTGPFVMDGYDAVLLHVRPMQYNPKKKVILAHPRIDVRIELTAKREAKPQPVDDPGLDRDAFGNLLLNPRRNVGARVNIEPPLLRPIKTGPELLIEYVATFGDAARKLAQWKNRRGIFTEIASVAPGTTAAALKTEIRTRRADPRSRLRHVLLFGDVDDIPAEVVHGNTTDYYYATPQDATAAMPLPLPWLSVGRIPVRDAAEAMNVVDQIIKYEKTPPVDLSYYRRFVCAAFFQSDGAGHETRGYMMTMERIRAFLLSLGYEVERVYTSDSTVMDTFYDGTPVPAEVKAAVVADDVATGRLIDAMNEGQVIIAHRDHGNIDGWSHPRLGLADLDRVTTALPSVFYSLNCLTGAFDSAIPEECFAEKNLRLPGTAPTLIASTELSATFLNNDLMLGLFDGTYGGLLPTFPGTTASYPVRFNRIGDILNYARAYLPVASADVAGVRSHFEKYHVVGDPSLEIWAHEPLPLHVKASLTVRGLTVQLSTLPHHCVVTVWHGDKMLLRKTPTSARFTIPVPAPPALPAPHMERRRIVISAWAPGFHYAETQVQVPVPMFAPVLVPR